MKKISSNLYDRMQQYTQEKGGSILLFAWSVAESIAWFILPDFLLFTMGFLLLPGHQKQRFRLWVIRWAIIAAIGSLCGTGLMIGLCKIFPAEVEGVLFQLPFTLPWMMLKITDLAEQHGLSAILIQPYSGIPVKIWTYTAISQGLWSVTVYLFLVTLTRLVRMGLVICLGKFLHDGLRKLAPSITANVIRPYWLGWLILYTLVFLAGLYGISAPPH